jgi:ABC-type branched-subunit amino acid transport system ATPase component
VFNVITGVYAPTKDAFCSTGIRPATAASGRAAGVLRTFQNIRLFGLAPCRDNARRFSSSTGVGLVDATRAAADSRPTSAS